MAVNWLLGAPVNVGGQFQQGLEHQQDRQRQTELDTDQRAYRQAQMEQARAQQADQAVEAHRDRFIQGAEVLRGVTDEASYQRAIEIARQAQIPLDGVPPNFDPNYVRNVVEVGTRLQQMGRQPQQQQPPNIQREVEYYRSIGRPDDADRLLARHAQGGPTVVSNGDGTFTILPPGAVDQAAGGQPQPAQPQAQGTDPAALEAQAAEAIANGADPEAVRARLQQLRGGAGQAGPQTFP